MATRDADRAKITCRLPFGLLLQILVIQALLTLAMSTVRAGAFARAAWLRTIERLSGIGSGSDDVAGA